MPSPISIIDNNIAAISRMQTLLADAIGRVWWSLDDWHDEKIFAQRVAPLVAATQLQVANITDITLARVLSELTGEPQETRGQRPEEVTDLRSGTTPLETYERPIKAVWWRQKAGAAFPDALRYGLSRALSMASVDVQLARTHTITNTLSLNPQVTGYKRVLSGSENCDLCRAASRNTYKKSRLLPIHAHCDCSVMPIVRAGSNPDVNQINQDRFNSEGSPEIRRKDVKVEQNNETGPMLIVKRPEYPLYTPSKDGWEYAGMGSAKAADVDALPK